MITEFARLNVKAGREQAFEAAFAQAKQIISQQAGFISLRLYRHCEQTGVYQLEVYWQDIASHKDGFRQSADYQQWKALLHHFYDPFPSVEYFQPIISA
ncbi:antibiotic biosynthesis monooxygenase [Pasteurellaceae bacterium Orientalotternb1]|nr:antibiotic biosynthesis monooxygenase [Pasteurellaceae bacterium Orientalotternb1]